MWTSSFLEIHSCESPESVWSLLHCMMSKISSLQHELWREFLLYLPEFISINAELLFILWDTMFSC